jgi:hypothetical protein
VKYSREIAAPYANAELVIIPGDTHCYDRHLDAVIDAVKRWIGEQLGA